MTNTDSTDYNNTLIEDISIISSKVIVPLTKITLAFSTFVVGVLYIININWILALIIVPLGLITALLNWVTEKKYVENATKKKSISVSLWKSFSEVLRGIVLIRIYKRENYYIEDINKKIGQMKDISNKQNMLEKSNYFIASTLFMFTIGIILIISSIMVSNELISIGAMVSILMYNHMITEPLIEILESKKINAEVKTAIKRIDKTLNVKNDVNIAIKRDNVDKIILQNVSYKYANTGNQDSKIILNNIKLKIDKKEKIGIIGKTGSGKSTLAKIISGLCSDYIGKIQYFYEEDEVSVLPKISFLFQNSYLFDDTIVNNIRFSNPNATEDKLNFVIKKCLLEEVIQQHKEVHIGENGCLLSGGEKARIRLAMTLLKKDASIYIFDELTASLDNDTIVEILNNTIELLDDKICIFIEHNMIIKNYIDKIYLIENGCISQI